MTDCPYCNREVVDVREDKAGVKVYIHPMRQTSRGYERAYCEVY